MEHNYFYELIDIIRTVNEYIVLSVLLVSSSHLNILIMKGIYFNIIQNMPSSSKWSGFSFDSL
jgi:hypothetical protein